MSRLRPECKISIRRSPYVSRDPVTGTETVDRRGMLMAVYKAVARRRSLAFGVLENPEAKKHCAMGWFWHDNNSISVPTKLVDEVAAVNDSVPADADPKQRWTIVMNWLRTQLEM